MRQRLKLKDERFLLLKRQHDLSNDEMQRALVWFGQFPPLGEAHALKEGFLSIWDQQTRFWAEAAYQAWSGNIAPELAPVFKDLTTALRNWHEEIFAYFERPITNAYTESINNLTRAMNRMGRGYSFEVIRAHMLYNSKALKDGSAVEIVEVDEDTPPKEIGFVTTQMLSRPARKKKVQRVVSYGPSIITLTKLLEEGHFE